MNRHASRRQNQPELRQQLVEEVEASCGGSDYAELVTELADAYELLDTLICVSGISEEQVRRVQAERRAERGGFEQCLKLLWTEEAL